MARIKYFASIWIQAMQSTRKVNKRLTCALNVILVVRMKKLCIYDYSKCDQWRFWSHCVVLRSEHMYDGTCSDVATQTQLCGGRRTFLLLLNTTCPVLANSVDRDNFASEKANWSGSALFVIKDTNFYQKPWSSNLKGWKLKVGMAS